MTHSSAKQTTARLALEDILLSEYNLPVGAARTFAIQAIHFWDEAGLVVLGASDGLSGGAQPVVDLCAGRYLALLDKSKLDATIGELLSEPTLLDVISCASALSDECAEVFAAKAMQLGQENLIIAAAEAASQSSSLKPRVAEELFEGVASLGVVAHSGIRFGRIRLLGDLSRRLPRSRQQLARLVEGQLDSDIAPIWQALLASMWDEPGAETLRRQVVLTGPPQKAPRESRDPAVFTTRSRDGRAFNDVLVRAARDLRPGDNELASKLDEFSGNGSVGTFFVVNQYLTAQGFPPSTKLFANLAASFKGLEGSVEKFRRMWSDLLSKLAEQGIVTTLDGIQRRRLSAISGLVECLHINEGGINDEPTEPALFAMLVDLAIQLGGFDRDLLASEATFVARSELEQQEEDPSLDQLQALLYEPPQVSLDCWGALDVPSTLENLRLPLTHSELASAIAASIMVQVPKQFRARAAAVAAAVAEETEEPRYQSRAAWIALSLDPSRYLPAWQDSADIFLAEAAIRASDGSPDRLKLLIAGLTDPDMLLRAAAAARLRSADLQHDEVIEAISRSEALGDHGTCGSCGEYFDERTLNCQHCHCSLPNSAEHLRRLTGHGKSGVVAVEF